MGSQLETVPRQALELPLWAGLGWAEVWEAARAVVSRTHLTLALVMICFHFL